MASKESMSTREMELAEDGQKKGDTMVMEASHNPFSKAAAAV